MPGPVLLVGAPGTGKRTVAEILHHFAGGDAPLLERVAIDDRVTRGRVGALAYLCPLEAVPLERQEQLTTVVASTRLILATRLRPESDEGRARLSAKLLAVCSHRIDLPPLRQRIEDVELLVNRILCETPSRRPVGGIDDDALERLRSYPWPGNVTELEAVIREAIEVGASPEIELRDLPATLRLREVDEAEFEEPDYRFSLAHAERGAIERAMRFARGNKRKAARLLRISKTTLYRKIQEPRPDDGP